MPGTLQPPVSVFLVGSGSAAPDPKRASHVSTDGAHPGSQSLPQEISWPTDAPGFHVYSHLALVPVGMSLPVQA